MLWKFWKNELNLLCVGEEAEVSKANNTKTICVSGAGWQYIPLYFAELTLETINV